jgi:large subunit ribosomal protein L31
MKADIHPEFHLNTKATCACGAEFSVGSSKKELSLEICSQCHPFFTGQEKVMDTARRVEKFKSRQSKAAGKK